ncbi:ABC transporter permease [Chengkuizengella marina]|uniref:ABC transporter permease subunit n=1 Tax=Chengkuizengella marina TaxID=2507566 RepID=A0A6N9Q0X9_9BACL|nr:ABC transporter permease subunit [Chengkuizengella marina]NBI27664.1 ABC transporter permease subunit [Chengkuizengella marina]
MGIRLKNVGWKFLMILFLILFSFPIIPLIITSFSAGWRWPEILPDQFSLRAWNYVFSPYAGTWEAIGNSIFIAITVTFVNILLCLPAANVIARMNFKGKILIEGILYAPLIIPPFITVMGIHLTFIYLGFTESLIGVMIAHIAPTLPYMLRALIISYQTIGLQWEEQASMLGAGKFNRLRFILLPHILPGIVAGSSLTILVSLSQYLITFLIGGGHVVTLPIILFPFISGGDIGIGSAYMIIFSGLALLSLWTMNTLLKRYYKARITFIG